ncbi:hypothetical protein [Leptospira broomii]|nr:hypothetical protein [Leptospira broomii]
MIGNRNLYFLSRPLSIFLLLTWIVNDSWGKGVYPGVVTGKLSDVSGLVITPLFVGYLFLFGFSIWNRKSYDSIDKSLEFYCLLFSILLTDILFIFINWKQSWNDFFYRNLLFSPPGMADRTDIVCIPISWLLISFYYLGCIRKFKTLRLGRALTLKAHSYQRVKFSSVLLLCIFALLNTSQSGGSMVRLILQEPERDVVAGDQIPILFYTSCSLDGIEMILYKDSNLYLKERIDKTKLEYINDARTGLELRKFIYVVPNNIAPGEYHWAIRILFSDLEYEKVASSIQKKQWEMDKKEERLESIQKRLRIEKFDPTFRVGCHETSDLRSHNIHSHENISDERIWRVLQ